MKMSCLLRARSREFLEKPFSCYQGVFTAKQKKSSQRSPQNLNVAPTITPYMFRLAEALL